MSTLRAVTADDLVAIRKRLHDVWFDTPESCVGSFPTEVRLSGLDERVVRRPLRAFGPITEFELLRARVALVVEHVVELQVEDLAQCGRFDLVSLDFDAEQGLVLISGAVPVELRLRVQRLDVRAEISCDSVSSGRSWGLRRRTAEEAS